MKPKSKRKCYNESDSSSDSDAPLVEIRHSSNKSSLFKFSVEKCEFCDKVFKNKYNMLVHNAKHIIIPLLNQKLHKCTQCQRYFHSIESLEWHSMNSHSYISDNKDYLPKILQSFVKREPMMILKKEPLFNNDSNTINVDDAEVISNREEADIPEILQSMVLKEPVTMLTKLKHPVITRNESILQSFVKKEPITLLKKESFEIKNYKCENDSLYILDSDDEDVILNADIKAEIEKADSIQSDSESSRNPKIKDRIKFEDEDDEIHDLNSIDDITNGKDVLLNLKKHDISNLSSKDKILSSVRKNAIILGNKPNALECSEVEWSVHYDELKRPGMFRCKKCSKMFPNRYEAIIHETSHLTFKRNHPFVCRYCDWYVSNSPSALKRHQKLKHPDSNYDHPKKKLHKCDECGLSFTKWKRHRRNYHEYSDKVQSSVSTEQKSENSRVYEVAEQKVGLEQVMWLIKTVKVCEFCYQWFKEKSNLKYGHVKHYFKLGERLQCERCDKLCFELRIVRMRVRRKMRDPLKQVDKDKDLFNRKSKKPMSNTDRLKNVQQRLKKMKQLNKF